MPGLRIRDCGRVEKRNQGRAPSREQRQSERAEVQPPQFVDVLRRTLAPRLSEELALSLTSGKKQIPRFARNDNLNPLLVRLEVIEAGADAHRVMPSHGKSPPNNSTENPLPDGESENVALFGENPGHQKSTNRRDWN